MSSPIVFSDSQIKLLHLVATHMKLTISAEGDWQKVCDEMKHSNVASTKARWNELVRKLKPNATDGTPSTPKGNKSKKDEVEGDDAAATPTPSKRKRNQNKPSKAGDAGSEATLKQETDLEQEE